MVIVVLQYWVNKYLGSWWHMWFIYVAEDSFRIQTGMCNMATVGLSEVGEVDYELWQNRIGKHLSANGFRFGTEEKDGEKGIFGINDIRRKS